MKFSERFRIWVARRDTRAYFFALVVLLWMILKILPKQEPQLDIVTHTLGSSTQHVDIVWLRQDIASYLLTANDGAISALSPTWDALMAIDIKTGSTNWEITLPFEQTGIRGLVADTNTIFAVQATRADAYETTNGKLKWSTELGYGHVTVIPQLDSGVLRIYYGDNLLEIDPDSGKMLAKTPSDGAVWETSNIILKDMSNNQLTALDKQTNKSLWVKSNVFYVDEGREPQSLGTDSLVVGYQDKHICALNVRSGKDIWCRPEVYISRIAIDFQSQLGYIVRGDMVLVTIELQTGKILGETSFLSSDPERKYSGFVPIVFSDGIVVVSFGDSGQTFGLSFR